MGLIFGRRVRVIDTRVTESGKKTSGSGPSAVHSVPPKNLPYCQMAFQFTTPQTRDTAVITPISSPEIRPVGLFLLLDCDGIFR